MGEYIFRVGKASFVKGKLKSFLLKIEILRFSSPVDAHRFIKFSNLPWHSMLFVILHPDNLHEISEWVGVPVSHVIEHLLPTKASSPSTLLHFAFIPSVTLKALVSPFPHISTCVKICCMKAWICVWLLQYSKLGLQGFVKVLNLLKYFDFFDLENMKS